MSARTLILSVLGVIATSPVTAADGAPKWLTEGPFVEQDDIALELPMEVLATKLFIEVQVDGTPRRFVFDTGSPSMISADLAAAMPVVDRRQGRDSNGVVIDTRVVQTDLTVGGTTFHKVPVYVADFPHTARCLFDGVLGSEVLPLCAWQIDRSSGVLRCNSELSRLDHVADAKKLALHDFGYPHAPIFDVRFARKAVSKAMFDTGSPEYLAISAADYAGAERAGGVGRSLAGNGSPGGSLGGEASSGRQLMVELTAFGIGELSLGRVEAVRRELSPSLIGAAMLEHFVITLDAAGSAAYFAPYQEGPFSRLSYGLGLSSEDDVHVSLVWDGSPAAEAGMHAGEHVVAINGEPADTSCDGIRASMRALSQGDHLELQLEDRAVLLERKRLLSK